MLLPLHQKLLDTTVALAGQLSSGNGHRAHLVPGETPPCKPDTRHRCGFNFNKFSSRAVWEKKKLKAQLVTLLVNQAEPC